MTKKTKIIIGVVVFCCACCILNPIINPSGSKTSSTTSNGSTIVGSSQPTITVSSALGDAAELRSIVKGGKTVTVYAYVEASSSEVTLDALADYYKWYEQKSQETQLTSALVVYTDKTTEAGEKMGAYIVDGSILKDVTIHDDEPVNGVANFSIGLDGLGYYLADDGSLKLSATLYDGSKFDPNAYGLTVEVNDLPTLTPPYIIVSVHGYSDQDFSTMRQVIEDAANAYGISGSLAVSAFDSLIGTEGSNGDFREIGWSVITSAPNEYETDYRADLYLLRG